MSPNASRQSTGKMTNRPLFAHIQGGTTKLWANLAASFAKFGVAQMTAEGILHSLALPRLQSQGREIRVPAPDPAKIVISESVKCRFSKCRFSVLNLKFDFISDGGCTREKQIQKALGSLPPCGNRCRFSESAICSSRVHPPSEIKSNFKFKTLRWRPLRWRLTLSNYGERIIGTVDLVLFFQEIIWTRGPKNVEEMPSCRPVGSGTTIEFPRESHLDAFFPISCSLTTKFAGECNHLHVRSLFRVNGSGERSSIHASVGDYQHRRKSLKTNRLTDLRKGGE